jgi:hypothetical protein
MKTDSMIGYLVWWTVPECEAPYADLTKLAAQVGLPADCVPSPPAPRHAWEKATNVGGARGLKMEAPVDLRNQVYLQYSADPTVRLIVRRISDAAPVLRRHLVREAVIPLSPDHWKQLSLQTVAVLEFNCKTNRADVELVGDHEGWVNGNLNTIINDIDARRRALLDLADGNDVREGVRKLLVSLHRVTLRGTGGVYFVPRAAPDAEASLKALRAYIRGLQPWKAGQLEPSCNVVRLNGEDAESIKEEILTSALAEFKVRLSELAEKVEPVLRGSAKGKVAERISQSATEQLLAVKAAIAVYRESLSDDLQGLTDMVEMAQAAVVKAAGLGD